VVAGAKAVGQGVGAAHDVLQATGDRGLQVAGDPHPLLLGRLAHVALAVAREALRALREPALQERLPTDPAADEQRQRHGHEREQRVPGRLRSGVGRHARGRGHDGCQRRGRERGAAVDVAAGRVEGDGERDERRQGLADEEAAERHLRDQRDRDGRERQQRDDAPPHERQRRDGDGHGADGPAAVATRPREHLEQARRRQHDGRGGIARERAAGPREDARNCAHAAPR
jgi:hypothetical protein